MTKSTGDLGRLIAASSDSWRLWWQMGETMVAAQAVITARTMMIGAGLSGSARMPFAEMNRLVPEKTKALSKAGNDAFKALATGPAKSSAADPGAVILDWWERSLSVSAAWWAPFHAGAMANARRLGHV